MGRGKLVFWDVSRLYLSCSLAKGLGCPKRNTLLFSSSPHIKFPINCKVARYMAPAALIFLKESTVENLIEREIRK